MIQCSRSSRTVSVSNGLKMGDDKMEKENFTMFVKSVLFFAAFVCSVNLSFSAPLTLTWSGVSSGRLSDASWSGATEGVAGCEEHKPLVKWAFRRVCPQFFFHNVSRCLSVNV